MSQTQTDYYELLGVSRGASDAEIKQSFRSLARQAVHKIADWDCRREPRQTGT